MKAYLYLLALAVSGAAWADNATAPAAGTTDAAPAAETQAAPAADEQKAPTAAEQQQATPAAGDQKAADATEQSGFSRGSVVRSVFATEIKDREPVDKLNNTKTDHSHVYYFTELRDMSGQTAVHRWEHDGKVVAEVKFKVRGPRWRVWSSKTFAPNATGEWKVSVVNGAGDVIASDMLDYTGPAKDTKSAPENKAEDSMPASEAAPADDAAPAQDTAPAQNSTPAQ